MAIIKGFTEEDMRKLSQDVSAQMIVEFGYGPDVIRFLQASGKYGHRFAWLVFKNLSDMIVEKFPELEEV